jgi:tetratricopeptide (TPR) repeat protein
LPSSATGDEPSCATANGNPAIRACTRLIESGQLDDVRLASAYNNRGLARRRRGDRSGAIADLDRAIRLNPSLVAAYNNRCYTYSAKKDFDHAISDCD